MNEYGRFSHRCYFDRWDGWQAAVRAAGYEPVGRPSGPANGNWKADSKDERRYYGPNWKTQRAKALERDSYVCQTPGCDWSQTAHREAFGKGLHVHHIQPLSSFEDSSDDVDFERANRLENLVTVCVQHHRLWERVSPLRPDTNRSPWTKLDPIREGSTGERRWSRNHRRAWGFSALRGAEGTAKECP